MPTNTQSVTYEEAPLQYCQQIYDEAVGRNDDLREINEQNRLFYEGIDEGLKTRGADTRVKRSSLYIHEMTPAIETRIGNVISRVEQEPSPLFVKSNKDELSSQEKEQLLFIEQQLNLDLRQSDYLTNVFREHILGAEIYRTPSCVKVGWGRGHRMVPEVDLPDPLAVEDAVAAGETPPIPRVRFVKKEIAGPFVDWLPPDQFLYEPNRSDFHKTSRYAIHAFWLTWDEVFAEATQQDWNIGKIKKLRGEIEDEHSASGSSHRETHQEAIDSAKGNPVREGFKDGRVLVTENYITTFDKLGREKTNLAIVIGNKILVKNGPSTYMAIKFPLVPIASHRLPGTIEGLSSVDRTKSMQRLFNELFNSYIDAVTYRIFPPFKTGMGFQFDKPPIYGPGEIWKCSNPDELQPVIENIGDVPDLATLMGVVSAKIRQTLAGASDVEQGFIATQYEKATATIKRSQGSARRATPTYKNYGEAIVQVSEMFLALNQQFHDDAPLFVMDVSLDVPSLTNVVDPDQEKQEAFALYDLISKAVPYQTPNGTRKINNLIQDIIRLLKRRNVDSYQLTNEEIEADLQAAQQMASAQLDKQAALETLELQQPAGG